MTQMISGETCIDCKQPIPPTAIEKTILVFEKDVRTGRSTKCLGHACAGCAAKAAKRGATGADGQIIAPARRRR